jgi:hypothetical protein
MCGGVDLRVNWNTGSEKQWTASALDIYTELSVSGGGRPSTVCPMKNIIKIYLAEGEGCGLDCTSSG